jgi:hypothetical protein
MIYFRRFLLGIIVETCCLGVSFGLYSLKIGREPMEAPFNLTATLLQMPGIFVAERIGPFIGFSGWGQWSVIFVIQSLLWFLILSVFFSWRTKNEMPAK